MSEIGNRKSNESIHREGTKITKESEYRLHERRSWLPLPLAGEGWGEGGASDCRNSLAPP